MCAWPHRPILSLLLGCLLVSCSSPARNSAPIEDWLNAKQRVRPTEQPDLLPLLNHFRTQDNAIECGAVTASIVLNALRLAPSNKLPTTSVPNGLDKWAKQKGFDPRLAKYTPESFYTKETRKTKNRRQVFGQPIKGKNDWGIQLRQYASMLQAHGLSVELRVAGPKLSSETIRKEIIDNLKRKDDFVIVNYSRKVMNQKGGGHLSPLGAYDKSTDSVLILDVNPTKGNFVWVTLDKLIEAMQTKDTIENRGYLLVREER